MEYKDLLDRIETFVKEQGLETGRYGMVNHSVGLPSQPGIEVRPEFSPVDGGHVVIVFPERVVSYVCLYPSNYNNWRVHSASPYATTEELAGLLTRLAKRPTGEAWS